MDIVCFFKFSNGKLLSLCIRTLRFSSGLTGFSSSLFLFLSFTITLFTSTISISF